jgi:hypothetical protein
MESPPDRRADLPRRLDELAQALADAVAPLRTTGPRVPGGHRGAVLRAVTDTVDLLRLASTMYAAAGRIPAPLAREAWARRWHALRTAVETIRGWLAVLAQSTDERPWAQAAEVIEQRADALAHLLRRPPG